MNDIPVRHIDANNNEPNFVGSITVRTIEELTQSSDLIHDFHRHDFFLILFIYQGEGFHEIDFVNYEIKNYSIFFIKPGQVHKLFLKKGSIGFILQFDKEFSSSTNSFSQSLLKKINHLNICLLSPTSLEKIHYSLNYIYDEYKKQQPDADFSGAKDPGVQFVRKVYQYFKQHRYPTIVMGASFRNTEEIRQLAGCDRLTISPALLAELADSHQPISRQLHAEEAEAAEVVPAAADPQQDPAELNLLGLTLAPLTAETAAELGLPDDAKGLAVTAVARAHDGAARQNGWNCFHPAIAARKRPRRSPFTGPAIKACFS